MLIRAYTGLYGITKEIAIVVDVYEDISNEKITFSVRCELDQNNNNLNYYDRHKNCFKSEKIVSATYEKIIETLMNEAIK